MDTTRPSLLRRLRDPDDRAAWEEFDRRYREWLIRFFRRRQVGFADAEDLVQRVFASLATGLPGFTYDRSRGRFRDYLFRCARNALAGRKKNCPDGAGGALFHLEADSYAIDVEDETLTRIWEQEWVGHHCRMALVTLRQSASPRDVSILERSLAGATIPELAREFGLAETAVLKVRQRIKARMEVVIAAQVAEEDRIDE